MKDDLHTLSELKAIFKYTDDSTLLAPKHTDIDISEEFQHIKIWSAANKLTLNLHKTTEIVFKRPTALYFHIPLAVDGIKQLDSLKLLLLGLMFRSNLKMNCRLHYILCQCAQLCMFCTCCSTRACLQTSFTLSKLFPTCVSYLLRSPRVRIFVC